jgi:pilus assembly protein Flp/PilA
MLTIFTTVSRLFKDRSGVTAIEYGLIASLIAVAIIVGIEAVGTNLNVTFNSVSSAL